MIPQPNDIWETADGIRITVTKVWIKTVTGRIKCVRVEVPHDGHGRWWWGEEWSLRMDGGKLIERKGTES